MFPRLSLFILFEIVGFCLAIHPFEIGIIELHPVFFHLQQYQTTGKRNDSDVMPGISFHSHDIAFFEAQMHRVLIIPLTGILELYLDHLGIVVRLGNIRQPIVAMELPAALSHDSRRLIGRRLLIGYGIIDIFGLFIVHSHNLYTRPLQANETRKEGRENGCSYLAKLTARVSRITVIFTCPG